MVFWKKRKQEKTKKTDKKTKKARKAKKKIIIMLLIGVLCTGILCTTVFGESAKVYKVQAARTEEVSQNSQIIYFEDGSSLTVTSDEEAMTITGTHVKSTSRISYATVGYHMTLEPTGGYVNGKEHREIVMLDKYETITDEVTTSYVLDRQSIIDGAYALFQSANPSGSEDEMWMKFVEEISINGGIEFYLHNIFSVIERTGGSGSEILSTSRPYHNLGTAVGVSPRVPGILNAVEELYGSDWSEGTKKKLPEYYDIHLKLYVKPCKTNVILATEEGEVLESLRSSMKVYQNAEVRYCFPQHLKEEINYQGETYKLTQASIRKSYVLYGGGNETVQNYSLSDAKGLKVSLSTRAVSFLQLFEADSTVYLICEKMEGKKEEEPKEEITEDGETYRIRYMEPENEIVLQAWEEENPYFDVESEAGGIPVNEKLMAKGELWRYLFEGSFTAKKGEITFQVPVRRRYHLVWNEVVGGTPEEAVYETFEDWREVEVYVPVVRGYSYAEVQNFTYYGISELYVQNGALPDGELSARMGEGMLGELTLPEISCEHYEGVEEHLKYPPEVEEGIVLPMLTLWGDGAMPSIPQEDFSAVAQERVSGIQVRNDAFCFDGTNYLTDEWNEFFPGMEISLGTVFAGWGKDGIAACVKSDALLIPERVKNGMHESAGEVVYTPLAAYPEAKSEPYPFAFEEINGVYVYTPVYCGVNWQADNEKYTQLVAPRAGTVQLVLDPEGLTSELWIGISNVGYHSARTGYHERDYAKTLGTEGLSYLARTSQGVLRNEVRFPFDVFRDTGMLYGSADDTYIPAGTWVAIGKETVRFYLPEWVAEGSYAVECRSVACNCPDGVTNGEMQANRNAKNYIATGRIEVQVSGRLFGFCLYDIVDYPVWEQVFRDGRTGRIKNRYENRDLGELLTYFDCEALYRYHSGIADAYGRKRSGKEYTLPVLAGEHPDGADAAVKAGYTVRFCVTTIGERMSRKDSYVNIVPSFFWVDAKGQNRTRVDLYYKRRLADGKEYLVRIGDEKEREDKKMQTAGSIWLGIPEQERAATQRIWGAEEKESEATIYTYSLLKGEAAFRTVKNFSYQNKITGHKQYSVIRSRGISPDRLLMLEQGNYFEYSLPYDVMAAEKDFPVMEYAADYGIDFTENFWKKEGFLIVSFDITAVVQGNAYLSYTNAANPGYCNMWELEGVQKQKRDKNGVAFCFYPGDVLVMPVMGSIRNDYRFGGIY